jgi:acetolactate synthase-1/2/3 large subunit
LAQFSSLVYIVLYYPEPLTRDGSRISGIKIEFMLQLIDANFALPSPSDSALNAPSSSPAAPIPSATPELITNYADLIVDYLAQLGIDTIFGVPGGAIEPLLNSLARSERKGGPRLVVARHECGAAFMDDGYFRETGKMGVVCSTTGPGATNLITGVASALADEIPMLVITAQTPLPKFGKRALQESSCTAIDTVGMFRYVTQFNTLISHPEQLESKLISAIMAAHRKPHGPVHISIPADILRMPAISSHINSDLLMQDFAIADDAAIARLCDTLGKVDSFALYIGNDVGKASKQIMEFIELTGTAFVTGPMGKTWVNEHHPLYRGVYGFAGHGSAKQLLQNPEVELILAVGTELGELGTSGWQNDLLNNKLVHIDSSIEHFTRSPMANQHVFGNIDVIFDRLIKSLTEARKGGYNWKTVSNAIPLQNINGGFFALNEPDKCRSNASPVKPQRLMSHFSQALPDNTRIFVDAGNGWSWATHYLSRTNNDGLYRIAMGYGSMAWSIGAAIGSAIGNRQSPTLCIVGDGSYLMSAQEITVAAQQQLPIVFVVLNDSAMGMVMHGQQLGQQESIGWELNEVDYALMAQAMGIDSLVIDSPAQLDQLDYHALFQKNGPTLLDVRIDRYEVPPMADRVKGLAQNGSATPGG